MTSGVPGAPLSPATHTTAHAAAHTISVPAAPVPAVNDLNAYTSPFSKPIFSLPNTTAAHVDFTGILTVGLIGTTLVWLAYTGVATYHWFRYSHRSIIAIPAVAIYIIVSGFILLYMASSIM
jgi:hypothetical protein